MSDEQLMCDMDPSIVKNRLVILSKRGKSLDRNIIYILKELQKEEYAQMKLNLVCTEENKEKFDKILTRHKVRRVRLVTVNSDLYHKVLATAEYIMTNSTLETAFNKKKGQKIINIWYRTVLKKVDAPEQENPNSAYYNMQKNLRMTDYFVVRNDVTIPLMFQMYHVAQPEGKMIRSGFPRNSIFLEDREERRQKIRTELGLLDKKIYLYVPYADEPTRNFDTEQFQDQLLFYVQQLNEQLNENEVCLIKYPLSDGWDERWEALEHVMLCSKKYDLYNYLDISDVLITDYSDCYYDYLISRKKIVLFGYDYPLLRQKVEFAIPPEQLGIPLVLSAKQLVKELRSPINYDSEALVKSYGTYDCTNAAEKLCQNIFLMVNEGGEV